MSAGGVLNTERSVKTGQRWYIRFLAAHGKDPHTPGVVGLKGLSDREAAVTLAGFCAWVRRASKHGLAWSSITCYCSAVTRLLADLGRPRLGAHRDLIRYRRALRRSMGYRPKRKLAVTPAFVGKVLRRLDRSTPEGASLGAAICTAWGGLLRNAEYCTHLEHDGVRTAALRVGDLHLVYGHGRGRPATELHIFIRQSKIDVLGVGETVVILATGLTLCAVAAVEHWLSLSKPRRSTSPAFLNRSGHMLTHADVAKVLKATAVAHGMQSDWVSTHSLRSGAATTLFCNGASDTIIKGMGRWASDCWLRYLRSMRQGTSTRRHFATLTDARAGTEGRLVHDEPFRFELHAAEAAQAIAEGGLEG